MMLALVCAGVVAGVPLALRKPVSTVEMPLHSFQPPFVAREALSNWRTSGATAVHEDRVVLTPPASDSYGFLWNTLPVLTNSFRAEFEIQINGTAIVEPAAEGFAFWYVAENITQTFDDKPLSEAQWSRGAVEAAGLTAMGSKARFDGFGVIFAYKKQSIVLVASDGSQTFNIDNLEIMKPALEEVKNINYRLKPQGRLAVRIETGGSNVRLSTSVNGASFERIAVIGRLNLKASGFVGFSGVSGPSAGGPAYEAVEISNFRLANLDILQPGEKLADTAVQEALEKMLRVGSMGSAKAQRAQIVKLRRAVADYLSRVQVKEDETFAQVKRLQSQVGAVEEAVREHVQNAPGPGPSGSNQVSADMMAQLKQQVLDVRTAMQRSAVEQDDSLSLAGKAVLSLRERNRDLALTTSLFHGTMPVPAPLPGTETTPAEDEAKQLGEDRKAYFGGPANENESGENGPMVHPVVEKYALLQTQLDELHQKTGNNRSSTLFFLLMFVLAITISTIAAQVHRVDKKHLC